LTTRKIIAQAESLCQAIFEKNLGLTQSRRKAKNGRAEKSKKRTCGKSEKRMCGKSEKTDARFSVRPIEDVWF